VPKKKESPPCGKKDGKAIGKNGEKKPLYFF